MTLKLTPKVIEENSPNKVILRHLNINSLRNKLEASQYVINRNLDIILLLETKLGDSFPSAQFILKGHGILYMLDRNCSSRGLLLYVRGDIYYKFLKVKSDVNMKSVFRLK